jgi:hypothetical protein
LYGIRDGKDDLIDAVWIARIFKMIWSYVVAGCAAYITTGSSVEYQR